MWDNTGHRYLRKSLAVPYDDGSVFFIDLGLGDSDAKFIGGLLKTNNTVKRLNLSGNNITDVESIGEALKENNTLKILELQNNQITDVESIGEALALKEDNDTLEYLDLSYNNITDENSGIDKIIDGLKTNNTLHFLNLENNNLSNNMKLQLQNIEQYKRDGSDGYPKFITTSSGIIFSIYT